MVGGERDPVAGPVVEPVAPAGEPKEPAAVSAAWRSVAILLILIVLSTLDRQIIALQVAPMKAALRLTDTQIALLQGFAFGACYAVAGLPIGWAVDRFSRRGVAYVGVTVWSLASAACGLAGNFWQLFAARTLVGAGEASVNPTAVSLIGDLFPRDRLGAPMGVYAAGIYLGSGVALAVGGLVVAAFAGAPSFSFPLLGDVAPWQAVFLVTGLPGVVVAFVAFLMHEPLRVRPAVRGPDERKESMVRFSRAHAALLFHTFFGFGLASFVFYALAAWTPAFLSRSFGLPPGRVGWMWGLVVAATGIVGSLGGGAVIDRACRAGLRDACLVVPAIGALLAWPFIAGAYLMPGVVPMLATIAVGLVLFGVIGPGSYAAWARIAPPSAARPSDGGLHTGHRPARLGAGAGRGGAGRPTACSTTRRRSARRSPSWCRWPLPATALLLLT